MIVSIVLRPPNLVKFCCKVFRLLMNDRILNKAYGGLIITE